MEQFRGHQTRVVEQDEINAAPIVELRFRHLTELAVVIRGNPPMQDILLNAKRFQTARPIGNDTK